MIEVNGLIISFFFFGSFAGHWRKLTQKEQAGGFTMDVGVSRVLYEAFSGLFL